jgi:phage terminase large subunit
MIDLPENKVRVELLPKQHGFLFCDAKEKMYDGAFGAGKSRVLAYNAVMAARHPGNLVGLFRKTLTSLKYTTLKVLLERDGGLPPVLPLGSYKHNKTEHRISIHGGGEIIYMGFDDPLRIASLNLGSAFVDEAREIEEDEYTMLLGRLRNTSDPLRQLGLATNPDSPSHFLYKRFYQSKDNTRAVFKSKSTDNFFLPQDYIDMLAKFTGQYRDRFVLGKWVAFEGVIYDNFSRDVHLVHRDISEFKWFLLSIDEGYKDPAVIELWGIDSDNRMHLLKMFYKRQVLPSKMVQVLKYYGMSLIAQLRPAGIPIECVRDFLAVDNNGRPGLTVEPDAEGTEEWLTEVESYHLDKNEKPAKGLDHAMDGTRYAAMFMKENVVEPRLLSLEPEKQVIDSTEKREEMLFKRDAAWN